MNIKKDPRDRTMSFSLWALVAESSLKTKGLARANAHQARMHPQSKDGSVLRLRSCRALSPAPPEQPERARWVCHLKNERN